jgi:hypothetical protein
VKNKKKKKNFLTGLQNESVLFANKNFAKASSPFIEFVAPTCTVGRFNIAANRL